MMKLLEQIKNNRRRKKIQDGYAYASSLLLATKNRAETIEFLETTLDQPFEWKNEFDSGIAQALMDFKDLVGGGKGG